MHSAPRTSQLLLDSLSLNPQSGTLHVLELLHKMDLCIDLTVLCSCSIYRIDALVTFDRLVVTAYRGVTIVPSRGLPRSPAMITAHHRQQPSHVKTSAVCTNKQFSF
uniref:Uncharacterized protein n=1 Tax=Arundo donax TaxID=35708 RepID=A0A0A9H5N3_ARUDO